jgi:predicted O-methyltransferase YrrM
MIMDAALAELLGEIAQSGRAHDEHEASHDRRMLNLEPETARLVSLFVRSSRRERVLEIGTSNGYSTLWLAWSVRPHDGRVISMTSGQWCVPIHSLRQTLWSTSLGGDPAHS